MIGSTLNPEQPQTKTNYVLVLDLGGTGLKAAIVSEQGAIAAQTRIAINTKLLPNGGAEQDAELWWQSALEASKTVIKASAVPAEQIIALCCDSQFSVIVPVDEQARPLAKAIHWFDSRGGTYSKRIMDHFPSVQGLNLFKALKWIRITGLAPTSSGVDSMAHMLFIQQEWPEIYRSTCKFLEPMDYLTARFCGRITATQHSIPLMMLSSNQSWDKHEYSEQLLQITGLDQSKLPELIPNNSIAGTLKPEIALKLGLSSSTQILSGILDNQAALIGSGAVTNFQGMIYLGTSLNINTHVPFKKTDIFNSMASIPGCLEKKYMLLCEQGLGGSCLDFFLQNILWHQDPLSTSDIPEDVYERVNKTAEQVSPGSGNVLFLPWLNGSLSPVENKNARGGFFNLSLETTRSDLIRAIMEGIAFNNKSALQAVQKFTRKPFDYLRLAGGGALSDIWAQIYADILELPIHQLDDPRQVTCRGAALNAFAALGVIKVEEIPQKIQVKKVYQPQTTNFDCYRSLYRQFQACFKRSQPVFDQLNGCP